MNRFVLRVPDELYDSIRRRAASEGVSMNQYLLYAITRAVSAEETRAYFAERAGRSSRKKALALLDSVADVEPAHAEDRLLAGRRRR